VVEPGQQCDGETEGERERSHGSGRMDDRLCGKGESHSTDGHARREEGRPGPSHDRPVSGRIDGVRVR
jgi:hypothetical protein